MRLSGESNQSASPGRGLKVKVNLLIFKDEKTKDAVTHTTHGSGIYLFSTAQVGMTIISCHKSYGHFRVPGRPGQ